MPNSKAPKRVKISRLANGSGGPHFDNAGHLDPRHAGRLLAIGAREPEQLAFVSGSRTDDDLAEELGQETVIAMTSGEPQWVDDVNRDVDEDDGGPFVITSAKKEFASGTDESNIEEATREPFPRT
jgi:hypothetical protein